MMALSDEDFERRREHVLELIYIMEGMAYYAKHFATGEKYRHNFDIQHAADKNIANCAWLTWVIVAPEPTTGASTTSASSNRHIISGTIAKDTLLFTLEAIAQSSDAFPPLKGAAGGLLFLVTCADLASGNKKQIRDMYKRVDGLADSLKRGMMDGGLISDTHQEAISALAKYVRLEPRRIPFNRINGRRDIAALNKDLEDIVAERKSRFKRYFSARRHREELQDVVWQLDNARANYPTAVATLNATTNARVLAHVQALTLVLGVDPMSVPGTRRTNPITFPSGTSHVEEV
ncbi:hypothetical protein PENSPDRAFT_17573 [Peniophora sp. CONT]|nr:hypothetical protein PENSPDRAFT_17573 [Peniophora sp. CONT]